VRKGLFQVLGFRSINVEFLFPLIVQLCSDIHTAVLDYFHESGLVHERQITSVPSTSLIQILDHLEVPES
jgi:hypothetical protein